MPGPSKMNIRMGMLGGGRVGPAAQAAVESAQNVLGGGGPVGVKAGGAAWDVGSKLLGAFNKELKNSTKGLQDLNKEVNKLAAGLSRGASMAGGAPSGTGAAGQPPSGGGGIGVGAGFLMGIGQQALSVVTQAITATLGGVLSKASGAWSLNESYTRMYGEGALDASISGPRKRTQKQKDALLFSAFGGPLAIAAATYLTKPKYSDPMEAYQSAAIKFGIKNEEERNDFLTKFSLVGGRKVSKSTTANAISTADLLAMGKQAGIGGDEIVDAYYSMRGQGGTESQKMARTKGLGNLTSNIGGDQSAIYLRELVGLTKKSGATQEKNLDVMKMLYASSVLRGESPQTAARNAETAQNMMGAPGIDISNIGAQQWISKETGASAIEAVNIRQLLFNRSEEQVEGLLKNGTIDQTTYNKYKILKDQYGHTGAAAAAGQANVKFLGPAVRGVISATQGLSVGEGLSSAAVDSYAAYEADRADTESGQGVGARYQRFREYTTSVKAGSGQTLAEGSVAFEELSQFLREKGFRIDNPDDIRKVIESGEVDYLLKTPEKGQIAPGINLNKGSRSSWQGLTPSMKLLMGKFGESGFSIDVNNAWRTREDTLSIAGAKIGGAHEQGIALDINRASLSKAEASAMDTFFSRPYKNESWHNELKPEYRQLSLDSQEKIVKLLEAILAANKSSTAESKISNDKMDQQTGAIRQTAPSDWATAVEF